LRVAGGIFMPRDVLLVSIPGTAIAGFQAAHIQERKNSDFTYMK